MINTTIPGILLSVLAILAVLEIFGKREKRFAPLFGVLIISFFSSILIAFASLPTPNLTGITTASLGMIFGLVYFCENYSGKGPILLYKALKSNTKKD